MTTLRRPWPDREVKRFFKALGPATVGSAGVQLALFADTIIASFLAAGALSALYYADRLYQLPGGVIGIAVGTVLLPEMARRIAAGDANGARLAQERAIEFTLLLAIPCVAAFLVVPDLIMRALFMRGKFTADDAQAAAATLAAYTIGLIPFVLMRSVTAPFLARGDTATPVKAALTACRDQHRVQDRVSLFHHARAGRPRAGHVDRRVDQFRPDRLVRPARRLHQLRCRIQARGSASSCSPVSRCSRRSGSRNGRCLR